MSTRKRIVDPTHRWAGTVGWIKNCSQKFVTSPNLLFAPKCLRMELNKVRWCLDAQCPGKDLHMFNEQTHTVLSITLTVYRQENFAVWINNSSVVHSTSTSSSVSSTFTSSISTSFTSSPFLHCVSMATSSNSPSSVSSVVTTSRTVKAVSR